MINNAKCEKSPLGEQEINVFKYESEKLLEGIYPHEGKAYFARQIALLLQWNEINIHMTEQVCENIRVALDVAVVIGIIRNESRQI